MIHITVHINNTDHDHLLEDTQCGSHDKLNMRGLAYHMFKTKHKQSDLAFGLRADSAPDQFDVNDLDSELTFEYPCLIDIDYYDVESGFDTNTGDVGTVYVYMINATYHDPLDEMLVRLAYGVTA